MSLTNPAPQWDTDPTDSSVLAPLYFFVDGSGNVVATDDIASTVGFTRAYLKNTSNLQLDSSITSSLLTAVAVPDTPSPTLLAFT